MVIGYEDTRFYEQHYSQIVPSKRTTLEKHYCDKFTMTRNIVLQKNKSAKCSCRHQNENEMNKVVTCSGLSSLLSIAFLLTYYANFVYRRSVWITAAGCFPPTRSTHGRLVGITLSPLNVPSSFSVTTTTT